MFEINVTSNNNHIMFFISEYLNHIVHVHVNEKFIFSDLKKRVQSHWEKDLVINKKNINYSVLFSEFDSFRVEYKVYNDIFDKKTYLGILLFFYCHFNDVFKYHNNSYNNYTSYSLNLNIRDIFRFNSTYFLFNSFMHEYYYDKFFSQDQIQKLFDLEFLNLSFFSSNYFYNDIINFNSSVNICFLNKSNNYYLSKILLSHIYLNV